LGSFGSDSSKSTKFGPDIPYTTPFRFFEGAKKSDTRGRHIGKIQYGHESFQPHVVFKQPKYKYKYNKYKFGLVERGLQIVQGR